MTWRPLSARGDGAARESYDCLHEGVPGWLGDSLTAWIKDAIGAVGQPVRVIQQLQRLLRLSPTPRADEYDPGTRLAIFINSTRASDSRTFDVVDALLPLLNESDLGREYVQALEDYLCEGGSAWTISADRRALERRVPPEVGDRARQIIDINHRSSHHAQAAWTAAYGRSPNPSEAYREAVKAVEAAALPIVSPNDATATLGKMIGEMKANRQRWQVAFAATALNPIDVLISMLELLWKSQHDRHASSDASSPIAVTQEQAEAAVHLSLTLVHWFRSGAVRRIS